MAFFGVKDAAVLYVERLAMHTTCGELDRKTSNFIASLYASLPWRWKEILVKANVLTKLFDQGTVNAYVPIPLEIANAVEATLRSNELKDFLRHHKIDLEFEILASGNLWIVFKF